MKKQHPFHSITKTTSTSEEANQETRCYNGGGNPHCNDGIPSRGEPSRQTIQKTPLQNHTEQREYVMAHIILKHLLGRTQENAIKTAGRNYLKFSGTWGQTIRIALN